MDSTQTVNCVEWCFGYGGNHLGLKRVIPGLRCLASSEIEAYAVANMVQKMESGLLDAFPVWTDCKTFPCELFSGLVDIFIASYPCQPFSSAGKRGGADDPRHLWPFVRRSVEIIRPRLVFFENVDGHVSLGLREVLTELALLGYRVENSRGEPTWGIFSAAEVGAPHNRKRVFILGKRQGEVQDFALCEQAQWFDASGFSSSALRAGELADDKHGSDGTEQTQQCKECAEELSGGVDQVNASGSPVAAGQGDAGTGRPEQRLDGGSVGVGLADADQCGDHKDREPSELRTSGIEQSSCNSGRADTKEENEIGPWHWPSFVARPGEAQHEWEPPRVTSFERGLGRSSDGRAANVDRLRLLGNGVYPATAALAFVTLYNRFKK